jgi:hypothetical protein
MQSSPQSQFHWTMVYQCHITKYCILLPLKSKKVEVASQLLGILLNFGAPCILQSDNGSEFTAAITIQLKNVWPQLHYGPWKAKAPSNPRIGGEIKFRSKRYFMRLAIT